MKEASKKAANSQSQKPNESPVNLDESLLLAGGIFWHENKQKILIASAVLTLIACGYLAWSYWQNYYRQKAAQAFAMALTPQDYAQVAQKFANTPVSVASQLLLAADLRNAGQITDSDSIYEKALSGNDKTGLSSAAALGLAFNQHLKSQGSPEKTSIEAFQYAAARFPQSYIVPFALFNQAELLLRANKPDQSAQILRAILADYPRSLTARLASSELQRINQMQNTFPASDQEGQKQQEQQAVQTSGGALPQTPTGESTNLQNQNPTSGNSSQVTQ
ncbi:MAG: hypothetical protein NZL93_01795, partial [Chthoniobacterales bacterium]|nr:hypothetical protein [Chthoniobacterales bacterium]